jgi:DNA-binding CsgD family transcriptional regulator
VAIEAGGKDCCSIQHEGALVMRTGLDQQFPDPAVPWLTWQLDGLDGSAEWLTVLSVLVQLLQTLLPCEGIVWNGVDMRDRTAFVFGDPPEAYDTEVAGLLLELDDHPMIEAYVNGSPALTSRPLRMSDLIGDRAFRRTRTWSELFRPRGIDHQVTVPTGGNLRTAADGWSLNRAGRDFSDRELALVRSLQPLLISLERAGRWQPTATATETSARLTSRELEVLALLADGLTAHAIASRLRVSPATVRKHLEHIYAKLGRRDRLQAVTYARETGLLTQRP